MSDNESPSRQSPAGDIPVGDISSGDRLSDFFRPAKVMLVHDGGRMSPDGDGWKKSPAGDNSPEFPKGNANEKSPNGDHSLEFPKGNEEGLRHTELTSLDIRDVEEGMKTGLLIIDCDDCEDILGMVDAKACIILKGRFNLSGIKNAIRNKSTRVIGPSEGIFDAYSGIDCIPVEKARLKRPGKGEVSILSDQGAMVMDYFSSQGTGVSKFASFGDIDVGATELLEWMETDRATKSVALLINRIRNGRLLFELLGRMKKPVTIMKVGENKESPNRKSFREKSPSATFSEGDISSGDISSESIIRGICRQTGHAYAETLEELHDFSKALAEFGGRKKESTGRSADEDIQDTGEEGDKKERRPSATARFSAFHIIAPESLEGIVKKAAPTQSRQRRLAKGEISGATYPFDDIDKTTKRRLEERGARTDGCVTVTEDYKQALDILEKDEKADCIIVAIDFTRREFPKGNESGFDWLKGRKKPIICCAYGSFGHVYRKEIEDSGVPVYPSMERVAKVCEMLSRLTGKEDASESYS